MPRVAKNSDFHNSKVPNHEYARTIPCHQITARAPFTWLLQGCQDFIKAPLVSLFYGLCFAVAAAAIEWLVYQQSTHLAAHLVIFPSLIVYMLLGPFLALGLYDASWQVEKGHKAQLFHSIKAINRNAVSQWSFAVLLCVVMIFWMRIASLLHALYPDIQGVPLTEYMPFLITGTLVGALIASIIFTISVFSLPLMMERRVDIMTAIFTSFNAVQHNIGAMLVWAGVIVLLVAIGFASAGAGMVIIMPILGYATWHGYRATIKRKH